MIALRFMVAAVFLIQSPSLVQSQQQQTLAELTASLPEPLGYWPFNKQFGSQDASRNALHGVFRSSRMVLAEGPFKLSGTAYTIGSDENSYVEYKRPEFNLKSNAFTISMFVKLSSPETKRVAPLLEFPMPANHQVAYGLNFWMWPDEYTLQVTPMSSGDIYTLPCNFKEWVFIGAIYDNETNMLQIFCNTTISEKQYCPDEPVTSDLGFVIGTSLAIPGRRGPIMTSGKIAGFSIYLKALRKSDITKVYQLSKRYAEEACTSKKCLDETCHADPVNRGVFLCECLSGSISSTCDPTTTMVPTTSTTSTTTTSTTTTKTTTKPSTSTSTSTTTSTKTTTTTTEPTTTTEKEKKTPESAKVKACEPGWGGENCGMAICEPECDNGLKCTKPNTCDPMADPEKQSTGLKREHIIGIIVGLVILIIVIIIIVCCCCKRKNKNKEKGEDSDGVEGEPLRQQDA